MTTQLQIRCFFSTRKYRHFSYLFTETYVVGIHYKCLSETLLMSTHITHAFDEDWSLSVKTDEL